MKRSKLFGESKKKKQEKEDGYDCSHLQIPGISTRMYPLYTSFHSAL